MEEKAILVTPYADKREFVEDVAGGKKILRTTGDQGLQITAKEAKGIECRYVYGNSRRKDGRVIRIGAVEYSVQEGILYKGRKHLAGELEAADSASCTDLPAETEDMHRRLDTFRTDMFHRRMKKLKLLSSATDSLGEQAERFAGMVRPPGVSDEGKPRDEAIKLLPPVNPEAGSPADIFPMRTVLDVDILDLFSGVTLESPALGEMCNREGKCLEPAVIDLIEHQVSAEENAGVRLEKIKACLAVDALMKIRAGRGKHAFADIKASTGNREQEEWIQKIGQSVINQQCLKQYKRLVFSGSEMDRIVVRTLIFLLRIKNGKFSLDKDKVFFKEIALYKLKQVLRIIGCSAVKSGQLDYVQKDFPPEEK